MAISEVGNLNCGSLPDMASGFDRLRQWAYDLLPRLKSSLFRDPSFKIFTESFPCDGDIVPIDKFMLHEIGENGCRSRKYEMS